MLNEAHPTSQPDPKSSGAGTAGSEEVSFSLRDLLCPTAYAEGYVRYVAHTRMMRSMLEAVLAPDELTALRERAREHFPDPQPPGREPRGRG